MISREEWSALRKGDILIMDTGSEREVLEDVKGPTRYVSLKKLRQNRYKGGALYEWHDLKDRVVSVRPKSNGAAMESRELKSHSMALAGEAATELRRACEKHAPMNTAHEGYAVILEELDELWDEVKAQQQSKAKMRKEAVQIAAMALRFVADVCDGGRR